MKTLYFDAFSGASGDMILGALIDLGADDAALSAALAPLARGRFELRRRRIDSLGLAATKIDVAIVPAEDGHDERNFREIAEIVSHGGLSAPVRDRALEIFRRLCEAEAEVHGVPFEKVHLHEAGAIDAIADVCGASWLLEEVGADRILASPLNVGSGTVECRHGTYPVPGPATARLLRGIPVYAEGEPGERVTPTGAAILSTVVSSFGPLPPMVPSGIGLGSGDRSFGDRPNVLRAILGESYALPLSTDPSLAGGADDRSIATALWQSGSRDARGRSVATTGKSLAAAANARSTAGGARRSREARQGNPPGPVDFPPTNGDVLVIETTIDDMNPQNYGFLIERALAEGALEMFLTPVLMKKGRPGISVTAIAPPERFEAVSRLLFRETTTIGFRYRREARRELARRFVSVRTDYGSVRLKISSDGDEVLSVQPEFEDCRALAAATNVPLKEIQRAALAAWSPDAAALAAPAVPGAAAKNKKTRGARAGERAGRTSKRPRPRAATRKRQ